MPQYKSYICDVQELDEYLNEINNSKETIIGCCYASDSQQIVLIVEGAKDIMKEKIKNLISPAEI